MNPGKSGGREKNHNRPLAYRNAPNFDANRKDDKLLVLRKTSEIWPISEGQIKTEGKNHKTNAKHPETMNEGYHSILRHEKVKLLACLYCRWREGKRCSRPETHGGLAAKPVLQDHH